MKIFRIIALAALVCACSQKSDFSVEKTQGNAIFSAAIENEPDTRASIGSKDPDTYKFPMIWNAGDSISVVGVNATPWNEGFKLVSGAGTTEATFAGKASLSSDGYYLVYPYNKGTKPDHTDTYDPYIPDFLWNGTEQTAHEGSFDPAKGIMIAYSNETTAPVEVSFKQVCSYIKFTTNYKCQSIVFEGMLESDYIACKDMAIKLDSNGAPVIAWANSQSNKITMTAADGGVIPAGTYYIAVLPRELENGFKITFTSELISAAKGTRTYVRETSKSANLKRGHVLNLGTMDLASNIAEFAGYGNAGSPFIVSDLALLKLVAKRVNAGESSYVAAYYKQTADIDVNGDELTPIGNATNMFKGNYNGNGFKISNPKFGHYTNESTETSALFGDIYNATIRNLTVENPTYSGDGGSNSMTIGIIAAWAYSSSDGCCYIQNCSTEGTVTFKCYDYFGTLSGGVDMAGGILGVSAANVEITGCTNNCSFKRLEATGATESYFYHTIGGILGMAVPTDYSPDSSSYDADAIVKIDRCRNKASLGFALGDATLRSAVGGIVGNAADSGSPWSYDVQVLLSNCVNSGMLYTYGNKVEFSYMGGIFGRNDSDGFDSNDPELFNCLNVADVYTDAWKVTGGSEYYGFAGGILGWTYDGDTYCRMCVNLGGLYLTYPDDVKSGEIIGYSGTIEHCFNVSDMKSAIDLNSAVEKYYSDRDAATWDEFSGKMDLDF